MNSYQRGLLDEIAAGASMNDGTTKKRLETAITEFTDKFLKTHK
jgi:hypothetical protein